MSNVSPGLVPSKTVTYEGRSKVYTITIGETYSPKNAGARCRVTVLGALPATDFSETTIFAVNENGKRTSAAITSFVSTYDIPYVDKPSAPRGLIFESDEIATLKTRCNLLEETVTNLVQRTHALETCLRTLGWKPE